MSKFGRAVYRSVVILLLFIIASNVISISIVMGELDKPPKPEGLLIIVLVGMIASIISEVD